MHGMPPFDPSEIASSSTKMAECIMETDDKVWKELKLSSTPYGEKMREYLAESSFRIKVEIPLSLEGIDWDMVDAILKDNNYHSCVKALSIARGTATLDEIMAKEF